MVRRLVVTGLIEAVLAGRVAIHKADVDRNVETDESGAAGFDRHASKACFLEGKGAQTLDPLDPEQPGWPSLDACQKACEAKGWCQAFTRGVGASSSCWLRTKVELRHCPHNSKYETYLKQGALKAHPKCLSYKHLDCFKAVQKHWDTDRFRSWAPKAFTPIFLNTSGVKFEEATIHDWQQIHWCGGPQATKCELPPCTCTKPPCDQCGPDLVKESPKLHVSSKVVKVHAMPGEPMGYQLGSGWVGKGWCRSMRPVAHWNANGACSAPSVQVNVLSYNLFWWQLMGVRGGADRKAGRLVESTGPWDFMGFQECDDVHRIVKDSRAYETHGLYSGTHAVSNAWNKAKWSALAMGFKEVTEDSKVQWYGRRALVWTRLQHRQTKKVVFFMNFHGALPVGGQGGGMCGGEASAYNILRVMGDHAHRGDSVIIVGDFNAVRNSLLLNTLSKHMKLQFQGRSFGGVDNFFTNDCAHLVSTRNLGAGGSDHDALGATFKI